MDWEAWPLTWSRFGLSGFTPANSVYMNTSVELVLADHPMWSPAKAEAEAGRRWDAAARTFIEATLSTLHTLRPLGRFGLFGWPDCDGHLTSNGESLGCSDGFRAMNDRDLGWLWNASSALFPSTCASLRPPVLRWRPVYRWLSILLPQCIAPRHSFRSCCHQPCHPTSDCVRLPFGQILHSLQGNIRTRGTGKI